MDATSGTIQGRRVDMEEYKITCGRTFKRGNWVTVEKNGYTVTLMDDHEKGTSQRQLLNKATDILDEWLQSEAE